jgi:hypothetical protein
LSRLARQFAVDEAELRSRLTALRRKGARTALYRPSPEDTQSPTPIDSLERELLELLTQYPQLTGVAAAAIDVQQLTSPAACEIYAKFIQLHGDQRPADFVHVLTELEDARLKSLLVDLDEDGRRKSGGDPDRRLRDVIRAYEIRRSRSAGRAVLAQLQQPGLDQHRQLELLTQILSKSRERQGISAPRDG